VSGSHFRYGTEGTKKNFSDHCQAMCCIHYRAYIAWNCILWFI